MPLRQACSVDAVDVDTLKVQLRDIARGIAVGGPAKGVASAASEAFPLAPVEAFGTLHDECRSARTAARARTRFQLSLQ